MFPSWETFAQNLRKLWIYVVKPFHWYLLSIRSLFSFTFLCKLLLYTVNEMLGLNEAIFRRTIQFCSIDEIFILKVVDFCVYIFG